MIEVARLELAAQPDLVDPSILFNEGVEGGERNEQRVVYIPDKKRLTLFQVVTGAKGKSTHETQQGGVLLEHSFDCDSTGQVFITDQQRYNPLPLHTAT